MFEEYIVEGDWAASFANLYNAFIGWFTGLDFPAQIIMGIFIVLSLVATGYLVYGILWLAYQAVKFSIVVSVMSVVLAAICIKMCLVLILSSENLESEWHSSLENLKWSWYFAYPSDEKQSLPRREENTTSVYKTQESPHRPEVYHITQAARIRTGGRQLFCTNCGEQFTSRMQQMMDQRMSCFCESCGQMFISSKKATSVNAVS